MNNSVLVLGAGGKMGQIAAEKIGRTGRWQTMLAESDHERAAALREQGLNVRDQAEVAGEADFVILAVPDAVIGRIAAGLLPSMSSGSAMIILDGAAAYVGDVPMRPDVTLVMTHPCHPPFFTDFETPELRADYVGGIAPQDMITTLISGSEEKFAAAVEVMRDVFAPVRRPIRVTLEQFVRLEPSMAELVLASAAVWIRQALEEAVARGVPREAAEAFMYGHARNAMAWTFGVEKSPWSAAAMRAIEWGHKHYIKPDWRQAFDEEHLREAIRFMLSQ